MHIIVCFPKKHLQNVCNCVIIKRHLKSDGYLRRNVRSISVENSAAAAIRQGNIKQAVRCFLEQMSETRMS